MNEIRKKIPIFAEPDIDPIEIGGLKCRIRRLAATEAPTVITAFLSDFGAITAEYLATTVPDQLIDLARGMKLRGDGTGDDAEPTDAEVEAFTMSKGKDALKTIIASQAFQRLAERFKGGEVIDLKYFTNALIIGRLVIEGVPIDTWEELDETRISPVNLGLLLYHSLEVNFDPGFGGPDASAGKSDPPEPSPASPESRQPSPTQTTKSGGGGSGKTTGRSARRRGKI